MISFLSLLFSVLILESKTMGSSSRLIVGSWVDFFLFLMQKKKSPTKLNLITKFDDYFKKYFKGLNMK